MTTSDAPFPRRLTAIDHLTRQDHVRLRADDECYFFGEYVSGRGYEYSPTNSLIMNFKKPTDRRGLPEWRYKEEAISRIARAFRDALLPEVLNRLTFVPIPPSKAKGHPLYDDRITRLLHQIRPAPPLDIRELIVQTRSTVAAHESTDRPTPEALDAIYEVDGDLRTPTPSTLLVVDDMLTTGTHFRAAKSVLQRNFPSTRMVGVFVPRRAFVE